MCGRYFDRDGKQLDYIPKNASTWICFDCQDQLSETDDIKKLKNKLNDL